MLLVAFGLGTDWDWNTHANAGPEFTRTNLLDAVREKVMPLMISATERGKGN